MGAGLLFRVDGVAGHPGKRRDFSGSEAVRLQVIDSVVDDVMAVDGVFTGTVDGVQADFTAAAEVAITCVRCLTDWVQRLEVRGSQHFSRVPDEDGYAIVGNEVDMSGPATDELALGIPFATLCRPDCRGLCPICGTDLNTDSCDGHGDDPDTPFAALKDLFDR